MRKFYCLICLAALLCFSASGQPFTLLKDINPGINEGIFSGVNYFTNMNGTFYFIANDGVTGEELWKSNGTATGTVLVKDINTGSFGSYPMGLFVAGNVFYFAASTEVTGYELWKSDGTAAGTVLVKDINTVNNPAGGGVPMQFTNIGSTIYFSADDGINGRELWKSDGTAAGTVMIKNINPGIEASQPEWLTRMGNEIYFTAFTSANGKELWKTDGTPAGTVLVKDINPGIADSEISDLVAMNNTVFFRAFSPSEGLTLMKTDGTTAGTVAVKPGNNVSQATRLTDINGTLFFAAGGDELWKSDGTAAGTIMLKDLIPSSTSSKNILKITNVNGIAFFAANDVIHGYELWKSDGTAAGTVMIKDINPGSAASHPETRELLAVGNTLLFTADDGVSGMELWISDGTDKGTYRVQDILPGIGGADPFHIIEVNNRVYISASDNVAGREIWSACLCFKKADIRNDETLVILYPNPLQESGTLLICVSQKENIVYRIFDAAGRLMQMQKVALDNGTNLIPLQTALLAAGAYVITVDGDYTTRRLKFIKQ